MGTTLGVTPTNDTRMLQWVHGMQLCLKTLHLEPPVHHGSIFTRCVLRSSSLAFEFTNGIFMGAGEMALRLRVHTSAAEDQTSVPSTVP